MSEQAQRQLAEALIDKVDRLEAENATLKADVERIRKASNAIHEELVTAEAARHVMQAESDRLRQAIAPLVNLARAVDPSMEDALELTCQLTAGELRTARSLSPSETEEGG